MPDQSNVLLVDDRPENLTVLEAILAPLEQNVFVASSGAEALKEVLLRDFAVILMDVQMPTLDGFETASLIRGRDRSRSVPIIFLTAIHTDDLYVAQAYRTGAVNYLYKPFDPDVLRSKVRVFVDLYEQRLQIQHQAEQIRAIERRQLLQQHRERERARQEETIRKFEERQRAFLRDVLASATGGKMRLCSDASELPNGTSHGGDCIALTAETLRSVRDAVRKATQDASFQDGRADDIVTAASEAAMNAVMHAGGGRARIRQTGAVVQVRVDDAGRGINIHQLPRATLERGYTTAGSLGHGFWLMLQLADRMWLLSGATGTTIVLEQERDPPAPEWLK